MNTIFPRIKMGWLAFELPQYREHPVLSTYSLFSYEDLPPIQEEHDDELRWLRTKPENEHSLAEGVYNDGSKPDLSKLSRIIEEAGIKPPQAFLDFIESADLQRRVRSCTDCYLDVADRATPTKGVTNGRLIHFLSDSQWCLHWYIYVEDSGKHFIAVSPNAYGFSSQTDNANDTIDASHQTVEIDLEQEDIWVCAPTFTEFIYRFWLENEIWFALAENEQSLTAIQQTYVNHYAAKQ